MAFWDLPGPFAPPDKSRPNRNITALSYSCTTYAGKNKYRNSLEFRMEKSSG